MSGRAWFTLGVVAGATPTFFAATVLVRAAWTQAEILAWAADALFKDRFPQHAAEPRPVTTAAKETT